MSVLRIAIGWLAALAVMVAAETALAQMCGGGSGPPGHSMDEQSHRDSEEPTTADVADAIRTYVREDAGLKGGYFLIYDPERQAPVALRLERVHQDRLGRVGERMYFACAEFESSEGGFYDLDIFVKGPDRERLQVAEIAVHVQDGVTRYTWRQEDGTWQKRRIPPDERVAGPGTQAKDASDRLEITVDGAGFHPSDLSVRAGLPAVLVVTRTTDRTCAKEIVIPALDVARPLPLEESVEIVIRPDRKGDIRFTCGMDMVSGVIHVE